MEDDRGMSEHVETAGAARLAIAAQERGPAVFSRLAGCYALEARGADAVEFLHGQLANDVKGLPDGGSSRSLLLNHKGQAMAEAQVLRLEPRRLVLVVDDDMGEWVRETLARHIVFDEVELTPVACEVVTIQGANARGAVEAAGLNVPAAGITVEASGGSFVYATSRTGAGGYDVLVIGDPTSERATSVEDALARAGAGKVRPGAIDAARVVTLVPTAGREGGEGVLPQEAGLEHLVSFRKGCYLGQEIMARIEARGSVRRALVALELSSEPAGRDVSLDGKVVGRLGTVARLPDGRIGALAVLRKEARDASGLSAGDGVGAKRLEAARMMPA